MTPQEIIKEIRKLPPMQQEEVVNRISARAYDDEAIDEDRIEQLLYERGIIGKPPESGEYSDIDEDFEPIAIKGEPLSETIIQERR